VYIRRVIGTGSSESTATAKGGLVTRLLADAPVGNQVRLAALRGIQNGAPLYAVGADSNKGWRHDSIGSSHGYRL
jgi:hypothetical protein